VNSHGATGDASRRDDIIQAAIRAFAAQGYRRTSMRDIAAEAGLSKAGLYHHVRTKEELLVNIYERSMAETLADEQSVVAAGLSPEETLTTLLRTRIIDMCESQHVHKILAAEESELPIDLMGAARKARTDRVKLLAQVIREGMKTGVFRPPVSVNIAVLAILGTVNFIYQWYEPKGPLSPSQLADALTEHLVSGIRTPTGDV
jgi:AcrR family transcriptional regulator